MKKDIKDYLHYYLGGELLVNSMGEDVVCKLINVSIGGGFASGIMKDGKTLNSHGTLSGSKLILRPLSDMTEDEAEDFALSYLNSPHAPEHWDTVEKDELQVEFVKNDGGLMLDDDVDLYFNVSCRCLDGYIAIMRDGRIGIANESDIPTREMQPVDDVYGKVHWLLSKHFDLFGLIESGLAIDKTKIQSR